MTGVSRRSAPAIRAADGALPSDARLLEMAAGRDVDAFDLVLRPRLDKLFRMAVAILRSEPDARDAVQETCVKAWRELPRMRDRKSFDAWLSQILVNSCRSHLRHERRVRIREIDVESMPTAEEDPGQQVAGVADAMPETEAIQRAFERLGARDRSLLILHYVEERPLAEIARTMDSPVGTIKWRLSNARQALMKALEVERR